MSTEPYPAPEEAIRRRLTRRAVGGAVVAAAGVPLVAACGAEEEPATDAAPSPSASTSSSAARPTSSAPATSGPPAPAGRVLGAADDIEVGGGVVFPDDDVVVTRPSEGSYVAFDARCTHQGCLVQGVEGGEIVCPCHGSRFAIADGGVVQGPAEESLAPVDITVADGQVVLPE